MNKHTLALMLTAAIAPMAASGQTTTGQKVDALQREVERLKGEVGRLRTDKPAPNASAQEKPTATEAPATSLFGYGEFSYNRFRDPDRTSRADLRRFVIGFGHRFDDQLTFNSEVEIEHAVASAGDRGEVEIEQAYLNYKFSDAVNVKGGVPHSPRHSQ